MFVSVCVREREREREKEREYVNLCVRRRRDRDRGSVCACVCELTFTHSFICTSVSLFTHIFLLIIFYSFSELGGANIGVILSAIFPSTLCIILGT
jgi:hypothetical protein